MEGFVGRAAETAEVSRLLADWHLVTVTGPGGVGKTRVARQAAGDSGERYPDGVFHADLSGLADAGLLPNTVAAALGMLRQESRPQLDAMLDFLRARRLLLVLDTCEHLIDACALLAEAVLREAPGVTIMATSRQTFDVAGEYVFPLPPLPVPEPGARPCSLDGAGDAAELFALRAAEAEPGFTVTEVNWPDVVRVCRRLDGMPLAIELAAVQLRTLSLPELASRLDQRFDLPAVAGGGPGDGAARHQTLGATIDWSHGLCEPAERELWARLSVFAGTFGTAAARDVCAGHGLEPGEILPALVGLVEKSVVTRDGDRYRMLDAIREFGAGRLTESGQERIFRGRHVGWYLAEARSFDTHFLDHDQPERVRALRAERDNIRAAIQYGLASDSERLVRDGAMLASALYGYWMASGLLREGRHWLGQALNTLPAGPSPERAWALVTRAWLGPVAGEAGPAVDEANQGVEMARVLGDEGPLLARGCLFRQFTLMFAGHAEQAFAAGKEARRRCTDLGDRVGLLLLEGQMAYLESVSGNFPAGIEACGRGLDGLREGSPTGEIGEQWLQGFLYLNAGLARFFEGGFDDSERCCSRALSIQVELQDIHGCSYALEGLAWLAANKERWSRAAWLLGAADTLWRQLDARRVNDELLTVLRNQTADRAREGLGGRRFTELFARGAGESLERVARYAIGDADDLPLSNGS